MKIKEIAISYKKGLPEYSSISATAIAEIQEGDNLDVCWDEIRTEVEEQCSLDPSWINRKQINEK